MNGGPSLAVLRTISDVASTATQSLARAAERVSGALLTPSFDAALAGEQNPSGTRVAESRMSLTKAIESLLGSVGITANPPIAIQADESGALTVVEPHPRAAEIESILASDKNIQALVSTFPTATTPADRLIVLHNVA